MKSYNVLPNCTFSSCTKHFIDSLLNNKTIIILLNLEEYGLILRPSCLSIRQYSAQFCRIIVNYDRACRVMQSNSVYPIEHPDSASSPLHYLFICASFDVDFDGHFQLLKMSIKIHARAIQRAKEQNINSQEHVCNMNVMLLLNSADAFSFFLYHRKINSNDDQDQTCVEDYLQVLTSILSEKR